MNENLNGYMTNLEGTLIKLTSLLLFLAALESEKFPLSTCTLEAKTSKNRTTISLCVSFLVTISKYAY